jgi:asparagine synthase (glutamine-hydrolysing)
MISILSSPEARSLLKAVARSVACSTYNRRIISWDRSRAHPEPLAGAPGPPLCLWARGFIANRKELISKVSLPACCSDPDLLVTLYERFGLQAPAHVAGPFSWILWDAHHQRLVAARDRLGIYGLYYTSSGTQVDLAGDVSWLHPSPPLNERAVAAQIRGQAPPAGETFFPNIHAIEPGHLLIITRGQLVLDRYWRLEPQRLLELRTEAAHSEALRDLFFRIISQYHVHQPAGVTLSGGLDSTTVAASLRSVSPTSPIKAFSWVSPELPKADESREILSVARKLGLQLTLIPADQHWSLRTHPGIRTSRASPFFNFYHDLWEVTFHDAYASGVRELHSGLGGDHLFGGDVFSYPDLLLTGRWIRLLKEIEAHLPSSNLGLPSLIRRTVLGAAARGLFPKLRRWRTEPPPWLGERLRHFSEETAPEYRRLLPGRQARLKIMQDRLLPVVAEAATAHAARHNVEFRHPLLDHRLCEFAAALPTTQTFRAGIRKVILRNAMRGLLPDEVVDRRYKVYSNAIAERGLREREQVKVWALMTNMVAADMGFVDEMRLREEYRCYLNGETNSALFWHTLTLESWLREHFA